MTKSFHAVPDPNAIPVRYDEEHDHITIDVNGYDDIKRVSKLVLRYGDRLYTYTGWNSDRNEAYFRLATSGVAFVAGKLKK